MKLKLGLTSPTRLERGSLLPTCALLVCAVITVGAEPVERRADRSNLVVGLRFSANPTQEEITRARVFEEPLVPLGGEPSNLENADLAAALLAYAQRNGPDDFAGLTGFLERHPKSSWCPALLTGLGIEYYNTAHYSLALNAWESALKPRGDTIASPGGAVLARATEELATLYARLGRMDQLEALLRPFGDSAGSEKISRAREALWLMKNRPEVSFRCGPLALHSILTSNQPLLDSAPNNAAADILNSSSTTNGFSLPQVAELSAKIGLNFQMAFREADGEFIVPSVVHWRAGHYAAILQQAGDKYFIKDPTFGNTVWATRQALEAETSGYFLIPAGEMASGWRTVAVSEGRTVWGKGTTGSNDGDVYTPGDLQTGGPCSGQGMPVASIHLMLANVSIRDTPLAYRPPVGPPVRFTFRFNNRDSYASEITFGGPFWNGLVNTNIYDNAGYAPDLSNFISPYTRMTHDWITYLIDSPQNPLADVKYVVGGGGARTFTGFNTNTQTFALQQYDQTLLTRTGTNSYDMSFPDGSKFVFSESDGSVGSSRRVYLSQIADPAGNALTFTYNQDLRVVSVADAIGQVTTVSYGDGTNAATNNLTQVTDPFGRSCTFEYEKRSVTIQRGILRMVAGPVITYQPITNVHEFYVLTNITDTLGLASQPQISDLGGFSAMETPYGTTSFTGGNGPSTNATMRFAEILYPDASRERVEYNQSQTLGIADSDPDSTRPQGMSTQNTWLYARNTYYWDRNGCARAYGDYSKARLYHWLHKGNLVTTSGILESFKQPLEGRVWLDYPGQGSPVVEGNSNLPEHIGRVLDDTATQLYTYAYNGQGNVTSSVDPMGRSFSYVYASNGVDLIEVRQTRDGNNVLLFAATYNSQHLPLTLTDAAGQTATNIYNARGQLLTTTNPKSETTTLTYDANGYLLAVDGPQLGTNDVVRLTHDAYGRIHTATDASGYTLEYEYDAMDRVTRVTHPDTSYAQYSYDRLDLHQIRDRAGQISSIEHDNMQRVSRITDPLARTTLFQWCGCGALESVLDSLGRLTEWQRDLQGRVTSKRYADGSKVSYSYENRTSRLLQTIDEQLQVKTLSYNPDNSLRAIGYLNTAIPTPAVTYNYDPDYPRVRSMDDEFGTTLFRYHPPGSPGAGQLAAVDGPWTDDTIAYQYDELNRLTNRSVNGVAESWVYDDLGRVVSSQNSLGLFGVAYEGASARVTNATYPSGQFTQFEYFPTTGDQRLQRITHRRADTSQISRFTYGYDVLGNITSWDQELSSRSQIWTAAYDAVSRLTNLITSIGGTNLSTIHYGYDSADNLLAETVDGTPALSQFNALNQRVGSEAGVSNRVYEWDARHRLTAVVEGTNRSEFAYDGRGRLRIVTEKSGGDIIGQRRFFWCGLDLREERDTNHVVTSRFFPQGEQRGGTNLYYFADHLGSVREVTDESSVLLGEFSYSPFGTPEQLAGDMNPTFGFTRLLNHGASQNLFAIHRAYDPLARRWLSRDPVGEIAGLNLYAYVGQNPLRWVDPLGYKGEEDTASDVFGFTGAGLQGVEMLSEELFWRKASELMGTPWYLRRGSKDYFYAWRTVKGFDKVAEIAGLAGHYVDALEVTLALSQATDCPSARNILGLTYVIEEILLTAACPPCGLALKGAQILDTLTGGPINFDKAWDYYKYSQPPDFSDIPDDPFN